MPLHATASSAFLPNMSSSCAHSRLVTEDATTPSTDGSESTRPPQTCGATRPEVECAPVDAVVNGEVQAVKVISDGDAVSPLLIVPDDHTSGEDIECG